jgi:hypothetical protein
MRSMDIWLLGSMELAFEFFWKRDLKVSKINQNKKIWMYIIVRSTSMKKFKSKFIVFEA